MKLTDLTTTNGTTFTPTGLIIKEDLTFEQWQELGRQLLYMEGAIHWWIGDHLNYGEGKYGEMYAQFYDYEASEGVYSYQTLRDDKWVAGKIELSRRRDNLSWSHHREIAPLEDTEQDYWMDVAIAEALTQKEFRRRIKRGQLEDRRQELQAQALEDVVQGKYAVIYADPPWQYSNDGFVGAAEDHYPTMATENICDINVADHTADNAILFLWATNPLLLDALQVIQAWGFDYKTNFCWVKDRSTYGKLGFYNYSRHELLLVAAKGSFLPDSQSLAESIIEAKKAKHSKKPDRAYEIIETMYPNFPYLELFARSPREGWHTFGNELETK